MSIASDNFSASVAGNPVSATISRATVSERLRAIYRRGLPMLITFVATTVSVVAVAMLLPATFSARGTILIEQQELPTEFVRSSISSFADQRLQVITQRVMTTDNLLKIIQRYDLYADIRKTKVREAVIQKMRNDIDFKMISADVIDPRSGHPTKATIAFTIGYSNRSPELAARVANELVTLYLQENVENRTRRAADATNFLLEEADRLEKRIDELQTGVARFKEKHLNDLPELAAVNIQLLTRTEEEQRDVDHRLRSLQQQIVYLDAQLVQISPSSAVYTSTGERVLSPQDRLKYLRTEYSRASALYSPTHPDVLRLQREIGGLEKGVDSVDQVNDVERQLKDATTELSSLRERYAEDHPDVVRLNRLVASLTAQVIELRAAPAVPQSNATPDNPAYIQLRAQREASAGELASLDKKKEELQARIRKLENRLESAPSVEHEYTSLVRELENSQIKYREVRQKQMEAQVSQNLEDGRKGERFTLIEPPLMPGEPSSPNRPLIMMLGIVLGLGGAVGMLVLLETLDGSVRSQRDLTALLRIPPLAVIPWIETKTELMRRRRRRWYTLASSVAGVVAVLVITHWLYKPLDVLWQVALRRIG